MGAFDDLIPLDTVVTDDPFADLIPQPVIRLAPPGSLRPDDLVPAIRKIGGEIVLGQRDETHPDIIDRTGLKATEIDQRGFAGPKGEFYDRESAAQGTQLPTWFEPGRLHSTDLIQGQEQASALTPVFGPVLKPGVTQDLSMFQRPEGFQEQLQAAATAEADLPRIEFPKAPPVDKDLTLREQVWTLPARVIGGEEAAKVQAQVGRSLYNAAVSVPEFFTTDEGLLSLLTGATAAGRPLVTGYFGYQMAQSVLDQTKRMNKDWDTLTPVQKADALTQLAAAGVLSLGLAKHTFTATEAARAAGFGLKPAPPIPEKGPEYAVKTREEQKGGVGEHPQVAEGRVSAETGDRDRAGEPAPVPEERPAQGEVLLTPEPKAAAAAPAEPKAAAALPEGPGAASVTDFPKEAQIEQLAREVGRVKGEKAPLLDRVKEAFNIGRQRQAAGDLVTRTLSGLKTAGDYLINTWRGPSKLDDILQVKGELSAELETRSWRLRQAMRDLKRAVPQRAIREAIAKYVDAGGDDVKLRTALASVPANRKAAYQRALNLTPDEKLVAGHIQSYFEARLQEAIDAGVLEEGIDDYIHRIYPKDTPWRRGIVNAIQNGLLDTRKPGLARQRVFELDADAERAGYQPISDFLPRLIEYEASLSKAIASRAAVKRFSEVKMADGRPMIDVAGMGTPIEDPATGVREATLIKPKFKPGQDQFDADGNPTLNYRKDYVARDYPALRKWRWATADADGNPIFVQGDVLIHPDAVKRMDKLLQPSQVREYGAARAALAVGSAFKQTMLDLSGFHQVQITVHGLEHKVNPFRLVQNIDFTNPDMQGLLRGGLTLGGDARSGMYQEGLVGRSLTRLVPGLGDLMQAYHEWLFQSYIPRMKTTMALRALERNRQVPSAKNLWRGFGNELASGKMTQEALYHQTAKEANAAFGELNYIMLERSKTAQDLSRLILLAPDFLEARGRFALQAGTRLGGEQRMALLLGALTMYITARLANKALSGEYHNEPENLFSIVYNGKAYSLRTVQGDILHALEEPLRFWLHRLNPTLTRPLLQLITQRDEFGRKRTFWQIMGDSISNIVPISLRRSREQQWHTALLNAFGGSVRRDSDVRRVYDAAAKYKKAHGIRGEPGEFIYDPASDVYRPLKLAILDGNTEAAAAEYRKLIDSRTLTARQAEQHFTRYARSPFTGSQKNEKKFFRSLSKEMQLQYEGAKQEKLRVLKGFRQARSMAASRKPTGAFDDLIPAEQ